MLVAKEGANTSLLKPAYVLVNYRFYSLPNATPRFYFTIAPTKLAISRKPRAPLAPRNLAAVTKPRKQ